MKILVISDTHRHINIAIQIINQVHDISRIIHLGDHVSDAEDLESIFTQYPIDYVRGNCDFYANAPTEKILNIMNKRILITHGHTYHVKYGYNQVENLATEKNVDAVLFGHTHVPFLSYVDNRIVMNPGSISLPRNSERSCGILQIDQQGKLHANIMQIKNLKKGVDK